MSPPSAEPPRNHAEGAASSCRQRGRRAVRAGQARRSGLQPGAPGQFFMVEAPGRPLPRPFSLCLAPSGELAFLVEALGPGTTAIAGLDVGDEIHVIGPLGRGFDLDVARPLLVGGGIGVAPFPFLSERLGSPPALLGFRTALHSEAASLVPNATVVLDPVLVTDAPAGRPRGRPRVRARADARRARATRRRARSSPARRRWRAGTARATAASSSATGIRSSVRRRARRPRALGGSVSVPILNASGCLDALDGARGRAVARRLRDEDDHARAAARAIHPSGSPRPSTACSTRSASRVPGSEAFVDHAPAPPRGARGRPLGLGRRLLRGRLRPLLRATRRTRHGRGDRAQPLLPERRGGARDGGRARGRGAGGDEKAAVCEAFARPVGRRGRRPRGRSTRAPTVSRS